MGLLLLRVPLARPSLLHPADLLKDPQAHLSRLLPVDLKDLLKDQARLSHLRLLHLRLPLDRLSRQQVVKGAGRINLKDLLLLCHRHRAHPSRQGLVRHRFLR